MILTHHFCEFLPSVFLIRPLSLSPLNEQEDKEDRRALMSPSNVDRNRLHAFAIEAAQYSTGHFSRALPVTEFAMDARGRPDCAVFDFTNLYSARNACQVGSTMVSHPKW